MVGHRAGIDDGAALGNMIGDSMGLYGGYWLPRTM